jgi:hypothetical protein
VRYSENMSNVKRVTVYFDAEVYRVLRLKAAASDRTISDLVNDAVRSTLAEDAEDIHAFEDRATEPVLDFEEFVKDLRQRGITSD